MNRRTMLAALSATAASAFPVTSRADTPAKISIDIANETGAPFQTYFKSLGDEYSLPTPARKTSTGEVPASDLVLVMFEAGPHGEKKHAYGMTFTTGAGGKRRVKLVTRTNARGVYIDTAEGADSVYEINLIMYLNS